MTTLVVVLLVGAAVHFGNSGPPSAEVPHDEPSVGSAEPERDALADERQRRANFLRDRIGVPRELEGRVEVRTSEDGRAVALALDSHPADGQFDRLYRLELGEATEPFELSVADARLKAGNLVLMLYADGEKPWLFLLPDTVNVYPEDTPKLVGVSLTRFAVSSPSPFVNPPWSEPVSADECTAGGEGAWQCSVGSDETGCAAACAVGYRSCCAADNRCACLDAALLGEPQRSEEY